MSAYSPDSFQAIAVLSVPLLPVAVLSVMTFILPTATESSPAGTERSAAPAQSYWVTRRRGQGAGATNGGHYAQPSRALRDPVRGPGRQPLVLRPAVRVDVP